MILISSVKHWPMSHRHDIKAEPERLMPKSSISCRRTTASAMVCGTMLMITAHYIAAISIRVQRIRIIEWEQNKCIVVWHETATLLKSFRLRKKFRFAVS